MAKKAKKKAKQTSHPIVKTVVSRPVPTLMGPQVKPLPSRRETDPQELKSIEDEIREIINWVSVFEMEYDLPKEAVEQLQERLHNIARRVGWLHCH